MAKRARSMLASCSETMDQSVSLLPNDVLIHILSLLPSMKDAAKISVLSHRWRHLWRYIPCLNFDVSEFRERSYILSERMQRYVSWVKQVIGAHKAQKLDIFAISCLLDSTHTGDIDSWVKFALEKGVHKLDLKFLPFPRKCKIYSFTRMIQLEGIKRLKSLSLEGADITEEDVNSLLSQCIFLERLEISATFLLRDALRISGAPPGSSLQLKYLGIYHCFWIKGIMISALTPNLVSFRYFGDLLSLEFEYAPKLVDLCIDGFHNALPLVPCSPTLSHYLPQLHSLTLSGFPDRVKWKDRIQDMPQLTCLKHLIVRLVYNRSQIAKSNLCGLVPLIKAAPFLHQLSLQLTQQVYDIRADMSKLPKYRHQHLRVVELGYFGGTLDQGELALYMVDLCASPEKLIIDSRDPWILQPPKNYHVFKRSSDTLRAVRESVSGLGKRLPPGVEFVAIIDESGFRDHGNV